MENENRKRAIILDMDDTLLHQQYINQPYDMWPMIFRPNLDTLIFKLKEAKEQGIDIVLCTTASDKATEKMFRLKPELKDIFNTIYTGSNHEEWMKLDEQNPLELESYGYSPNQKPITTFGYDQVLFIDDNFAEGIQLDNLFKRATSNINKDVTFINCAPFSIGDEMQLWAEYLGYSYNNTEIADLFRAFIEKEKTEPGCGIMCSAIDQFMNKEFEPGLIIENGSQNIEHKKYAEAIDVIDEKLYSLINKVYGWKQRETEQEIEQEIEQIIQELAQKGDYYEIFLQLLGRGKKGEISPEEALKSALDCGITGKDVASTNFSNVKEKGESNIETN